MAQNILLKNKKRTITILSIVTIRRNLYRYSLIQKQIEKTDERIIVRFGGQHSAGFRDFRRDDKSLQKVELETILK